ncbi:unnamed protein product [Schistosoma mattheei]|uniref:SNF2 N-terminal domain-containing protein n=1 Tax=Schistosoma mattheei TaxID=31246 RepID=A0A183PJH1_9TREM|nr:unnamed protein product [Schistosoma mattheei]
MGTLDSYPSSSTSNSKKCMNNPMRFSINKDVIKKAENQDVNSIQRIVAYDHLEFETKPDEDLLSVNIVKPLSTDDFNSPIKHLSTKLYKVKRRENNAVELKKLSKSKHNDDADINAFQERLRRQRRTELLEEQLAREHEVPSSNPSDEKLDGGFCVPGSIWCRLFDYQRKGVKWLWDLHQKGYGGIIGDEMGLGKTIQIIALLAGLHYSNIEDRSYRLYLSTRNLTSECQQE